MWRKMSCCEWSLFICWLFQRVPRLCLWQIAAALGFSDPGPSWDSVLITCLKWNGFQIAASHLFSPKGRGGQSALRFARLRMEKRHNYVRKVAETAVQLFISGDKVNVAGLVLAGSADFKTELSQSDMFDQVSGLFWAKPECLSRQ